MILTSGKNSHKRILGDKRTYGTRNIRFFWNSERYLKENIYHAVAMSLWILIVILFILYIPIFINEETQRKTDNEPWNFPSTYIAFVCFISLFASIILKINERKIRKQRIKDTVVASGREIKILGGNN
ncbi:MAG: hypothetical protein LBV22_00675 [Mycoplasmataceae bacterium]|jgi:hypothetical protein|nr:hypothetical protein [Mycoplasmataceae bacterium]